MQQGGVGNTPPAGVSGKVNLTGQSVTRNPINLLWFYKKIYSYIVHWLYDLRILRRL